MIGWRPHFQVSGLSNQAPGPGNRVQIRALDLYLHLKTRTRDLRAERQRAKGRPETGWSTEAKGRADHPWSAAVERGSSTLPLFRLCRDAVPTLPDAVALRSFRVTGGSPRWRVAGVKCCLG